MLTVRSERKLARPAAAVAGMRAKVNVTLTVRSSVYLILHKLLLIYVDRVAQVVSKCICYYSPSLKKFVREFKMFGLS